MIRLCELPQPLEVYEAVTNVIKGGRYVKGALAREFGDKWAERCGMKYGISVGSGAQALELAVKAVLGSGNQITYSKHTFQAVPNAIRSTGNSAVAKSREEEGYWPDIYAHHLHDEEPKITPHIEDCSHCHGYHPVAETAIFSLFPTKILGACGEAGVIVTNNPTVKTMCEHLASHGFPDGTNARMDEIQAAILLAKLPNLDKLIARRLEIVDLYDRGLGRHTPGRYHYMYCIEGTEKIIEGLIKAGVESKFVYEKPYVALPFYPEMTNEQVQEVINIVLEVQKCVTQL